jgi:hypothetical protein
MFKRLRTSTKLILLCAMFIISVGVTTYSLLTEKRIAISFARKELISSKFLAALRGIDVTLLNAKLRRSMTRSVSENIGADLEQIPFEFTHSLRA